MKWLLSTVVTLLLVSTLSNAQNKTFSIGTPTANPNAALQVESPGNNQGILIPRLTTVQRTSLSAALTTTDVGLIVFDTDSRALAIWNGTTWDLGSKVGAPITIDNAAATGGAANLVNSNAANADAALVVNTTGSGNAIETTGKIQAGQFIGDGAALTGITGAQVVPNFGAQAITTTGNLSAATVTATGNVNVNGQTYTWPGAQSGGVLTNNGSGTLSWTSVAGTGDLISTANLSDLSDIAAARTNLGLGTLATLGSVTSGEITDGTIENKDISALATIAGTKIDPNFGASNISTTGSISAGSFVGDGSLLTNLPGGGGGWSLTGNGSTTAGTNFIGTTDAQDLAFKTNSTEQMRIYTNGQVGIGTSPIAAKFDVGVSSTQTIGIHAGISSPSAVQNRGIQADASGSTAQNIGVYSTGFIDGSNGAIGVYGEAIGNGTSDAFGLYGVTNNFTSTTGKTYGLFASAEGGSTNWAGYFYSGNVHIKNGLSVGSTDGTFGNTGEVLTSQGVGVAPIWAPVGGFTLPYSGSSGTSANTLDLTNTSSGYTIKAVTSGTGAAGYFENTNGANSFPTFASITNGTGLAGYFQNTNVSNTNTVLMAETAGGGLAFNASTTGTSTAGQFDINNASNSSAAVKAQTNGTGVAVKATNTGTGMAGDFTSSNSSQTLYVLNTGSGRAGQFTGSGSGNATLQAQNNGAGGSALALFQTNVGYALDIQQGGVKLSNQSVVAPATITTKAALYEVTGTDNVNLPSGTVGETCWVANNTASPITVNSILATVPAAAVRQFIFTSLGWKPVN